MSLAFSIPASTNNFARQQLSFSSISDRLTSPNDLSLAIITGESSFPHDVDWSNRAHYASHCWLPYLSKTSSTSRLCACSSRKNSKSTNSLPLQCETCSLIINTNHLIDLPTKPDDALPLCRPSFTDSSRGDDNTLYDRHHWSQVSNLPHRCQRCRNKSSSTSSNNLLCLWCSQTYHQQCWEKIADDMEKSQCDYGKYREIIVRPQWLHRLPDYPSGFRAQMSNDGPSATPVIFFINKISGGQQGDYVYRQLLRFVNPRQVFLIEDDTTITKAFEIYKSLANTRVCICGGDGTVGWILTRLVETFPPLQNPPASICPLGTGNDLSRILGWGSQFNRKSFLRQLLRIPHAKPIALDRWRVQIESIEETTRTTTTPNQENTPRRSFFFRNHPRFIRDADQPFYENHHVQRKTHFFSYMSFGLDAAVVLDFHVRRTRDPSKFTSPFKNKLLYLNESRKYTKEFALGNAWNLSPYVRLICDDIDVTDALRSCNTFVLLNTSGFGSGTRPWGRRPASDRTSSSTTTHNNNESSNKNNINRTIDRHTLGQYEIQDFGDQKLEVLGLNSIQMALIQLGFRGQRIAQCHRVRIELTHPMPVHMDGEPFYFPGPSTINITHAGQVMVLRNEN